MKVEMVLVDYRGFVLNGKQVDRFWNRVMKGKPRNCWPWLRARTNKGYGVIRFGKRNFYAHRVAWTLVNGPIPEGLLICHHCDNPGCVNPTHLFMGTHADNTRDMHRKGRNRSVPCRGEKCGTSKLKEIEVHKVRRLISKGHTQTSIAKLFGVHLSTIHLIKTGKNWRHLVTSE